MPRSLPFLPASAVGRVLYELLISHSHTSRWYKAIDLPRLGREKICLTGVNTLSILLEQIQV